MSAKHQVVLIGGVVASALISTATIWVVLYWSGVL